MNNFDMVFSVVKEHCGDKDGIDGPQCFEKLSKATRIPVDRLDFYLNTLESIGLIKYSIDNEYLKLTPYGKLKKRVFAE